MATKIPVRFHANLQDQVNIVLGRIIDRQIHAVIHFAGCLDAQRLRRAVRLLVDQEPILGCRLIEHPRRPYWQRREDLDAIPICDVIDSEHIEEDIQRFIAIQADPFLDPILKVTLFHGREDTLVIKINHTATDGAGTKECLYLLAQIYDKLGEEPHYEPIPNIYGDRSFKQVFFSADWTSKRRMLKSHQRAEPNGVFPYRQVNIQERAVAIRLIKPGIFRKIKQYGCERGATVNDMLLAAFYQTAIQCLPIDPTHPFPVQIPIDLRPYIKRKRAGALCNLVGEYIPAVFPSQCRDFDETLIAVKNIMGKYKATTPCLGIGALVDAIGLVPPYEKIKQYMEPGYEQAERTREAVPTLTNVGIIDSSCLKFGLNKVLHAYIVSPIVFPPHLIVGVSTFDEMLTLTAGYCRENEGVSAVETFMNMMAELLESLSI